MMGIIPGCKGNNLSPKPLRQANVGSLSSQAIAHLAWANAQFSDPPVPVGCGMGSSITGDRPAPVQATYRSLVHRCPSQEW
jgi:hypothetical protein